MIQLRLTTNPGIEDVVEKELYDRASQMGCKIETIKRQPFDLQGQVLVESQDEKLAEVACKARSLFHVMRQVYHFSLTPEEDPLPQIHETIIGLDIPEMHSAQTFRVTTKRSGGHQFKSADVQKIAGAALNKHYGTAVSLDNYDVNVRVDVYDRLCLVSVQLTREGLDRRQKKLWRPRISLKTTIAYGMLHLAQLEGTGRLLDPFCGSGTILIEAASLFPSLELYGSDRREEAIKGTQENLMANHCSDRVHVKQLDARDLATGYPAGYFRAIVTNAPYGMRLSPEIDFSRLYGKFLHGAEQILAPGGCIVILVGKGRGAFKKLIARSQTLEILEERLVETGELYPHLFVIRKSV